MDGGERPLLPEIFGQTDSPIPLPFKNGQFLTAACNQICLLLCLAVVEQTGTQSP